MILYADIEDSNGMIGETGLNVQHVLTIEPGADDYSTTQVTMANGLVVTVLEPFNRFVQRVEAKVQP